MISQNNKNIKAILSVYNNKEIIRITDTINGEIVWEKNTLPAEIDYFYVQNTYNGTNTLTVKQTLTGTLDSNTYAKQIQYSKDKTNWTTVTLSSTAYTISLNSNEKVYFRGDEGVFNYWYTGGTNKAITTLNCSQQYIIGGNINTLLDYNNPNRLTLPQGAFSGVFENDTNLTSASEVTLPPSVDGSLSTFVYCYLFRGCTGLITAPKSIPATKQGKASCYGMFIACSSLTTAPTLPATTLAVNCFNSMFYGCNSLTTAPALPATTLTDGCYWSMFKNCSSLTQAPEIQATTLAGNCCNAMFYGCVKLTKAPTLLATTLANYSYNQMFYGCSKLNEVTTYAEDISAVDCLKNWLYGVASTGTFYNNGSANFTINSASGIPTGWTNVVPGVVEPDYFYLMNESNSTNTIKLTKEGSPTSTVNLYYSTDKSTWNEWVEESPVRTLVLQPNEKVYFKNTGSGLSTSNTRYYYFSSTSDFSAGGDVTTLLTESGTNTLTDYCFYFLFYGCTKLTTAPALPATILATRCYEFMFNSCKNLTSSPTLPATTLAPYCYHGMFSGATNLKTTPQLPATTLATHCYESMFSGCTGLTTAPTLPATTLATHCYYGMFYGCTDLTTAPALPATTLADSCYESMFERCSSLKTAPALPATKLKYMCYYDMFRYCYLLNKVTTYADDISAPYCTNNWLNGVALAGTFYNYGSATYVEGDSGIPSGWTVVTE